MREEFTITTLTDDNFCKEVLEVPGLVLVAFEADWSGSNRIIAPIIEQVVDSYQGRIKFGKLDVDENKRTAAVYAIHALPTFIFFKNGQVADYLEGMFPKEDIEDILGALLKEEK